MEKFNLDNKEVDKNAEIDFDGFYKKDNESEDEV
jgi:hypothetical protein